MALFKKLMILVALFAAVVMAVLFYARVIEPRLLVVNRLEIKANVKRPLKVVFFADTHFGALYSQKRLAKIVGAINGEEPDIVIFGGDFFDNYATDSHLLSLDYITGLLGDIKAKEGKISVWGNRDYGSTAYKIYPEMMEKGGFKLLRNEGMLFDDVGCYVYGLDDYLLGKPAISDVNETAGINILVSHAPDVVLDVSTAGNDLTLAGHSHGGQVRLPFFENGILPIGAKTYSRGLYKIATEPDNYLFVSTGVGVTRIPYRFRTPPEIVAVTIDNE